MKILKMDRFETHVDIFRDQENNRIHLVDTHGPTSLTNSIDWVAEVFANRYEVDPHEVEWVLYHGDGYITTFDVKTAQFSNVDKEDPKVYQPFRKMMDEMNPYK
jgi:hypothetical protein